MSKAKEITNLSDKLRELKLTQEKRVLEADTYRVEEWDLDLKIKRLTLSDQERAAKWAAKNYPSKKDSVTGVACVCISDLSGNLLLNKETVDFLLDEPVDVLTDLVGRVMEKSGLK